MSTPPEMIMNALRSVKKGCPPDVSDIAERRPMRHDEGGAIRIC